MQSIQQIISGSHQAANPGLGVASSLTKPRAAAASAAATGTATGSTASSSASTSASTITANDFLTLLVAEMKNQDPTTPTDPAQYISQMVDVNSLQQLIGINQGISSLDTAAGAATAPSAAASPASAQASTSAHAETANAIDSLSNGASNTDNGAAGTPTWLSASGKY